MTWWNVFKRKTKNTVLQKERPAIDVLGWSGPRNVHYTFKIKQSQFAEGFLNVWVECQLCKNNDYINLTVTLCYEKNSTDGDPFYKCLMTNIDATRCLTCVDGYYLESKDYKCSKIEGCELSENENKCLGCNEDYCLDVKKGTCEYNDEIEFEKKKFYHKRNITNDEGAACEICLDGYELKMDHAMKMSMARNKTTAKMMKGVIIA